MHFIACVLLEPLNLRSVSDHYRAGQSLFLVQETCLIGALLSA